MQRFLLIASLCLFTGTESSATDECRLSLISTDDSITIKDRGQTVLVYNKQSPPLPEGVGPLYQRSGMLHPLVSPAGHVVTDIFPEDHLHQDGVFSAWVKTTWRDRSIDFWNLGSGTGRVVHTDVLAISKQVKSTGFEVRLLHQSTEEPAVNILAERWKITVWARDECHCFDLETTQEALTDSPLKIYQHRYGGVALRASAAWLPSGKSTDETLDVRQTVSFLNDQGSDRIAGNHQKARWVVMSGDLDEQPVSVAVLCHVDNFRSPQTARLHPTKPYFCFAPCVEDDFVIDAQHPYHARYRFLITDTVPDTDWLNEEWNAWCHAEDGSP